MKTISLRIKSVLFFTCNIYKNYDFKADDTLEEKLKQNEEAFQLSTSSKNVNVVDLDE